MVTVNIFRGSNCYCIFYMAIVYILIGKQLLLPILHGDCVNFQRKQLLLPILHGDCEHFQGKQLLLHILHGDCVHFNRKATVIAYFTW